MPAVFALQGDKAPGSVWFCGGIISDMLDYSKRSLVSYFQNSTNNDQHLRGMNANFIALIAKVLVARNIKDFRPISLTTSLQ